jgi:hypothetical protein
MSLKCLVWFRYRVRTPVQTAFYTPHFASATTHDISRNKSTNETSQRHVCIVLFLEKKNVRRKSHPRECVHSSSFDSSVTKRRDCIALDHYIIHKLRAKSGIRITDSGFKLGRCHRRMSGGRYFTWGRILNRHSRALYSRHSFGLEIFNLKTKGFHGISYMALSKCVARLGICRT